MTLENANASFLIRDETRFEVRVEDGVLAGHSAGDGPPALVLHGGPGLPDYMAGCVADLAGLFSTFRYTQRGTAPSTVGGPYSVETHMSDAMAVLDAFEIEQAWIVGHSWGGHLALHLAVAHRERLRGIVCIDTLGASSDALPEYAANLIQTLSPEERARVEEIEAKEDAGEASEEESLEQMAILWPRKFFNPMNVPPLPYRQVGIECSTGTTRSVLDHFEAKTLENGLPRVESLPVLFVHGANDPLPARTSLDTAALLSSAHVELIADCAHFPWIDQPGELRRAVADFLESP
jgi:proline iminopeptidase